MKLYRKAEARDIDKLAIQLMRASGNIKKQAPHGFGAVLCFDFGDVFLSDRLFLLLTDELRSEIDHCMRRMIKEDYGAVDADVIEANGESRYFGNGVGMLGKYQTRVGEIQISLLETHTYIELII